MDQRILLVGDEQILQAALSDHLRRDGYAVDCASNGTAGFYKARSWPFNLMIFDLVLPGCDGIELCRDVRSVGLETPILMITACQETAVKVAGLKAGADDCVTKPFDMRELSTRVAALLRRPPHWRSSKHSAGPQRNSMGTRSVASESATVAPTLIAGPLEQSRLRQALREQLARRVKSTPMAEVVPHLRRMLDEEKQKKVQSPGNGALLRAAEGTIEFLEDILHDLRLRQQ